VPAFSAPQADPAALGQSDATESSLPVDSSLELSADESSESSESSEELGADVEQFSMLWP
jgi:hypothetical protein